MAPVNTALVAIVFEWHGMYGDAVQRLCGELQVDISKARSLLGDLMLAAVAACFLLVPVLIAPAQ